MHIKQATYADLPALMDIFEEARRTMRASGNMHQWDAGYPSEKTVINDISERHCFVLYDVILGTMALFPGPEPTYAFIDGAWPDDAPYYVIHRIASGGSGRKIATRILVWAFTHIAENDYRSIRIDTHRDNCIMKHILAGYGFTRCGVMRLQDGSLLRCLYHVRKQLHKVQISRV